MIFLYVLILTDLIDLKVEFGISDKLSDALGRFYRAIASVVDRLVKPRVVHDTENFPMRAVIFEGERPVYVVVLDVNGSKGR